jgi:hypothetical protein
MSETGGYRLIGSADWNARYSPHIKKACIAGLFSQLLAINNR